jgi:hypothetical protein
MKQIPDNLILIEDDGKKKTSQLLADCKKLFPVWSYYSDEDLDRDFPPVTSKRYFKKVQEADKENKNKSAKDCENEGIQGITLRERLIFEFLYFKETGNHLVDMDAITLCTGSRYRGGGVPSVYWDADGGELVPSVYWDADCGELYVDWCYPRVAYGDLRARAEVSLDTFSSNPSVLPDILQINGEKYKKISRR